MKRTQTLFELQDQFDFEGRRAAMLAKARTAPPIVRTEPPLNLALIAAPIALALFWVTCALLMAAPQ